MKYFVTVNGNKYEVEVETDEVGMTVAAPGASLNEVKPGENLKPKTQSVSGEVIAAPMPGKIIDVKVKEGQSVKKGELILILEAMKMENEIMAPRDGVIAQILVNKLESVDTGNKLVILS